MAPEVLLHGRQSTAGDVYGEGLGVARGERAVDKGGREGLGWWGRGVEGPAAHGITKAGDLRGLAC